MSISNINKNILSIKILDNINTSLGIDNSSLSSKTKLIADAFAEEISTISASTINIMNRYSSSTAESFYLDIVGAENNIYRNNAPYITTDENVSIVMPISQASGFDDLLIGREIISTGEQVTIDSNYVVTFLRPVIIASKFDPVECFVRLESYDIDSNIYINKDSSFAMSGDNNPYLEFVKLKILTDINIQISPVDDDTFRMAIQKAKVLKDKTTIEAVSSELILVQNLNGYTIDSSAGKITLFIVTDSMVQNSGEDSRIDKYKSYLLAKIKNIVSAGIEVDVVTPDRYIISVKYENNSSIPTQIIKDVIIEFFKSNYVYAENQIFDSTNITKRLHIDYPAMKEVYLTKLGLFDPILNKEIIEPQSVLNIDKYGYITLSQSNISEE